MARNARKVHANKKVPDTCFVCLYFDMFHNLHFPEKIHAVCSNIFVMLLDNHMI